MVGTRFSPFISAFSPKMMLIDSDESFRRGLVATAHKMNCRIESRTNIVDIYRDPPIDPDILILAYDLGRVNGVQLSQFLERHARANFVILVIQGGLDKLQIRLPNCVKAVIAKESGTEHILAIARRLFNCYRQS